MKLLQIIGLNGLFCIRCDIIVKGSLRYDEVTCKLIATAHSKGPKCLISDRAENRSIARFVLYELLSILI